mmetsp:Transcript_14065/g.26330  ORF Transcript_14065/g.26330 Transcript_14065/m.26330 type:complete len:157 (-) Transcript_14065:171-641(-)
MEQEEGIFSPSSNQDQLYSILLGDRRGHSPKEFNELLCRFSFLVKKPTRAESVPRESSNSTGVSKTSRNHSILALTPMRFGDMKDKHNASYEAQRRRMRRLAGLETLSKPQRTSLKYKGILLQSGVQPQPLQSKKIVLHSNLGSKGLRLLPPIRHL